jgi:short-subunit dehydrogenase
MSTRTAIIVGASSGIGEELARQLSQDHWRLGLLARRTDRLAKLAAELGTGVVTSFVDVSSHDCEARFQAALQEIGNVDLVIIAAGIGDLNPEHDIELDRQTVAVNVSGFLTIAHAAFQYFEGRKEGHLAAITSVAALRGSGDATVYAASKAFQSVYLDGLRDSARLKKLAIAVTELQPGFVETQMMKTETPLTPLARRLLVSDTKKAATQMLQAIARRRKHAYVSKRYGPIALLIRLLPRPGA